MCNLSDSVIASSGPTSFNQETMMNNPKGKTARVSAFALASLSHSVGASISVEDVIAARPDWSRELCRQFLQAHGHVIAEAMEASGQEALMEIIPRSSDAN